MIMNSGTRTVLLGGVEMNTRFAKITSPEIVVLEQDFYGYLASHAGKEVGARELVLIMLMAFENFPRSFAAVSMKEHVDAMLGESRSAKLICEEFLDIMCGAVKLQQEMRSAN